LRIIASTLALVSGQKFYIEATNPNCIKFLNNTLDCANFVFILLDKPLINI
jgi:hypothetical protein